ncbi:protein of unknown function [Cyanobium sp. NIES-981]|nr:protein of unknown function [Cyanobium sp. NIES-981]
MGEGQEEKAAGRAAEQGSSRQRPGSDTGVRDRKVGARSGGQTVGRSRWDRDEPGGTARLWTATL